MSFIGGTLSRRLLLITLSPITNISCRTSSREIKVSIHPKRTVRILMSPHRRIVMSKSTEIKISKSRLLWSKIINTLTAPYRTSATRPLTLTSTPPYSTPVSILVLSTSLNNSRLIGYKLRTFFRSLIQSMTLLLSVRMTCW